MIDSPFRYLAVTRLRLPQSRHTPGSESSPALDYLASISRRLPQQIQSERWRANLPYRYGWFLYLNGYYWEAHEVWEPVWLRSVINSRERFVLQGIIQLANAGLKERQGKLRAGSRIRELALTLFDNGFGPENARHPDLAVMGIKQQLLLCECAVNA